jgi:tRNA (guanine-N(7)-)-methyltransferase
MGRSIRIQKSDPPEAGQMPDPLLPPEVLADALDWQKVFGRRAPVEMEIGFGKGRYLIYAAQQRPETDFLGVERALPFARLVRYRTYRRLIPNIRLLRAEADEVLERVPDASLRALHVLFPDPWPKKRHHKRRLIRPEFVRKAVALLEPGGLINVATDHREYAQVIEATLEATPGLGRLDEFSLDGDLIQLTNYGEKYAREGRSFHAWSYHKTTA